MRLLLTSMECAGGLQFDEIKFSELISHRKLDGDTYCGISILLLY